MTFEGLIVELRKRYKSYLDDKSSVDGDGKIEMIALLYLTICKTKGLVDLFKDNFKKLNVTRVFSLRPVQWAGFYGAGIFTVLLYNAIISHFTHNNQSNTKPTCEPTRFKLPGESFWLDNWVLLLALVAGSVIITLLGMCIFWYARARMRRPGNVTNEEGDDDDDGDDEDRTGAKINKQNRKPKIKPGKDIKRKTSRRKQKRKSPPPPPKEEEVSYSTSEVAASIKPQF